MHKFFLDVRLDALVGVTGVAAGVVGFRPRYLVVSDAAVSAVVSALMTLGFRPRF